MKKLILSCSIAVCSMAIATTAAVTSVEAQSKDGFWDSSSPQVIEKIAGTQAFDKVAGRMVTFKSASGESNNYYLPNWIFSEYNLKVGNSAMISSRDENALTSGDRYSSGANPKSVDTSSPKNLGSGCIPSQRYRPEGSSSTKQVLLKTKDCLLTIPVSAVSSGSEIKVLSIDVTQF
jgi:hypothetical protein